MIDSVDHGLFQAGYNTPTPTPEPLPGAVGGLHVSEVTADAVTITWQAAERAASYNVYRFSADEPTSETPYQTGVTETSFTDEGLPPSGAFRYTVEAVNPGGGGPHSLSVSAATAGTTPGGLDPLFGNGGTVLSDFGADYPFKVSVQPDGKTLVANFEDAADNRLWVVRYNPDGTLDSTYGAGGRVMLPEEHWGPSGTWLHALPDGGALVGGLFYPADGYHPFFVTRYDADGNRDMTFGDGGIAARPPVLLDHTVTNGEVMNDGRIVLAGGNNVVRLTADGQLDPTFGGGGVATGTGLSAVRSVAVQADGKIVIAGSKTRRDSAGTESQDMAATRLNADGSLDYGFGSAGQFVFGAPEAHEDIFDVAVQPDGKLVLGGRGPTFLARPERTHCRDGVGSRVRTGLRRDAVRHGRHARQQLRRWGRVRCQPRHFERQRARRLRTTGRRHRGDRSRLPR